jgi:hypothetical protein
MFVQLLTISPIYAGDWILFLAYASIILFLANRYANRNSSDFLVKKYFFKGILLKIIGGLGFAVFHIYVQQYGDTFSYHETSKSLTEVLFTNPSDFFSILFKPISKTSELLEKYLFQHDETLRAFESNFSVIRIDTLISPITLGYYMPSGLLFSILSFGGIWQGFKAMCKVFAKQDKNIAIAFLYFPTVIFWGSGLMKDTICLGALSALLACSINGLYFKERLVYNLIMIGLLSILLYNVKSYIILSYLPCLALLTYFSCTSIFKSVAFRASFTIFVILITLAIMPLIISIIDKIIMQQTQQIVYEIVMLNNNLQINAGSAYNLGITPDKIIGLNDLAMFFPAAIVCTFFRPFIWEANGLTMLLSAIESTFFILLVLYTAITGFFIRPFVRVISHKILISNFIFCILFGGLVGLSTSNFGSLVRYKMPCIPIILSVLLLVGKPRGSYVYQAPTKHKKIT